MTANPDDTKKCPAATLAGWLYGAAAEPGWRRRSLLAIAVILLVVAVRSLWGGTDYREEPSLLVPRSAAMFVEVRDFAQTFAAMNEWPLWVDSRRGVANHLQMEAADALADLAPWLAARQTLALLSATERAAVATLVDGETREKQWALYLSVAEPEKALADMALELGQTVTPAADGKTSSLSGDGDVTLHFAAVGPWLVVSAGSLLPEFAVSAVQTPALSLGSAGVLPEWARGETVRMVLPANCQMQKPCLALAGLGEWVNPKARIGFAARLDGQGSASARLQVGTLPDEIPGQGARALWMILLTLLAVLCVAVIAAILLFAIGWGGWLKVMAVRSGVTCAAGPAAVEPSDAFREDSGEIAADAAPEPETTALTADPVDTASPEPALADADEPKPESKPEPGQGGAE